MYYGVEQSTDLRNQRTVIKKFTSIKSLYKWLDQCKNDYTYADPEGARNWHRTIREGYKLCGRINKKDTIFSDRGTSTYPRNENDNMATYIWKYGERV